MDKDKLFRVFNAMIDGKKVRITKEGRAYWKTDSVTEDTVDGQWFYIQAINDDGTVRLCSEYHYIFDNFPLDFVKI
jgi:hypothetical protein